MRTRRGGRPLSGGSDAAVTGDGQTEQLPPCPALPVKNAPTKPLSQESNAPCAGSSGKAKQFVAQISQTRAYVLLLIRTCPHFGVSTPGDPTRVRAKDNLKLLMLVKEIGVRDFLE